MLRTLSMTLTLFGFWLLLSGHTEPLLLGLGLFSCLLVTLIAVRMQIIDQEGHPVHLGLRIIPYWIKLLLDIFHSNLHVARIILSPKLPIQPGFVRIDREDLTDLEAVILANSITLAPGTISTDVSEKTIEVHTLDELNTLNLSESGNIGKILTLTGRQ